MAADQKQQVDILDTFDISESRFGQLDRSRSFGEIPTPAPEFPGAAYEQHGFFYDHEGHILEELITEDKKDALRKLLAREKARKEAEIRAREVMKEYGLTDGEIDAEAAEEDKRVRSREASVAPPGQIDLKAWAMGMIDPPFDKVSQAIKKQLGRHCTKTIDAVEFLAKHFGIPANNVRPS